MSTLGLHVGELQRVTAQLEADLAELGHYDAEQRASIAIALSDIAVRLELARISVLGSPVEGVGQDSPDPPSA